jgi:two-component system CheB/CheR fusion protein
MNDITHSKSVSVPSRALVAIGASAGGLEPIRELISHIPHPCGLTFLIIQHTDPNRKSAMAELAADWSPLPAQDGYHNAPLLPDMIYFIPSGFAVSFHEELLQMKPLEQGEHHRFPINEVFASLADYAGPRAVGVILSGAGFDGAQGILSLKELGGLTLAEEPTEARFSSMPEAAINTGHADIVTAASSMTDKILQYLDRLQPLQDEQLQDEHLEKKLPASKAAENRQEIIKAILALLNQSDGNDFSDYKSTTIKRRILRRMGLCNVASFADYLNRLNSDAQELKKLGDDMLIGVTGFYRDPEAFDLLRREVIPALFANKDAVDTVRVWVAGCATGEEAYTIACALFSYRKEKKLLNPVQIFASDIDTLALEVGRAGIYPALTLDKLPDDLRDTWFQRIDGSYKVKKEVRECIIFAAHNLISDPPFSRLDIVICRNVLIYLNPTVQQYLMGMFSMVLNSGGYLFLGSSETIGAQQKHFETISKQWRIFRNVREDNSLLRKGIIPRSGSGYLAPPGDGSSLALQSRQAAERNYRQLAERYGTANILLSKQCEILYTTGKIAPFLELTSGEPQMDLFTLLTPSLRSSVRPLIRSVLKDGTAAAAFGLNGENKQPVRITVKPVPCARDDRLLMLTLEEDSIAPVHDLAAQQNESWAIIQLEQELQATREDLQQFIEKLSYSNEELKTVNEEFMAMNEELQSANEELESSKEELQSLNEELQTANNALDVKINQLEQANDDLNNLLSSTDLATIFLDSGFRIKRFTPASRRLLSLLPTDLGRPLTDIANELVDHDIMQGVADVAGNAAPQEFGVTDKQGRFYLKRVLPYRTNGSGTDGTIITFLDVTALKTAENQELFYSNQLKQQAQLLDLPLVFARDLEDRIIFWNHGAERFYGWTAEEAMGKVSHDLLHTRFLIPREQVGKEVKERDKWLGELVQTTRAGKTVIVSSQWVVARNERDQPWAIVEVDSDISDSKSYESQVEHLVHHDPLTHLPNQALLIEHVGSAILSAELTHKRVALLLMDLDRFRIINDSLGHETGNQLLVEFANRMIATLDSNCTLARFGGDEFAILVEGLSDINQVTHIADELLKALKPSFTIGDHEFFVGASIGISLYPDDARQVDGLVRFANAAMNLAKEEGRGQYKFFTPELNRRAHRALSVETRLRMAIERHELTLLYQPQVDIHTGKVVGAEALVRWVSPEMGRISPDEFIPIAEDSGIVVEIGEWVFQQVFSLLERWHQQKAPLIRLSLNISPRQFRQPAFLQLVTEFIGRASFPPAYLELELTERVLVDAREQAIEFFSSLRRLGLRISLDDFGTGYCSLQYLRHLRLAHLKIAREFVPMDGNDLDNMAISSSILSLAKALDIECTIEGVESRQQLEFFRKAGGQVVQGYLFSKPLTLRELETVLANGGLLQPQPMYD